MLVLARRECDHVFIGDDIVVTVVEVEGGRVRLGITAPKTVRIDRHEVAEPGHPGFAIVADIGRKQK